MKDLEIRRANRMMLMLFGEWKGHGNEGRPLKIEWNIMHMFTSSQIAKLYALKKGLDPELCALTAVLHDIAVVEGKFRENHDGLATEYVKGAIQRYNEGGRYNLDPITEEETETILSAVTVHGYKSVYSKNPYAEMIKDVDSIDAYLHGLDTQKDRHIRVSGFLEEIGIDKK
ncbi:MAG TPA: HD domain-containing protein [Clostridia bacterium]|nr:HD domain-containing protein [Clostridia bacterium]HPQ46892.1 HD domain-containing protein [Clostridia bacterium]